MTTTHWQTPPGGQPPGNGGTGNGPTDSGSNQGRGKRFAIVAGLLVVIAGLAAAAGLVMVNRGDDSADEASYVVVDTPNVEPVFEPRDAEGNNPFFPLNAQLTIYTEEVQNKAVADAEANGDTVVAVDFDVEELDAAVKTGLYGGTAENTCDPERLISFLYANPDEGEAWAGVQGIEFEDIADYIRNLDVRVLAEPVEVLNHGYNATTGAAYEIKSVLDSGTAVLVDENGDVRARCYCGNPIKPKPPTGHMPPRCITFGVNVYTEPSGREKRGGAPRDVLLTGRETTIREGLWLEVKWGNDDDEKGWVTYDNLQKHYCPPPTYERLCPGPGATNVWRGPSSTTKVGEVTGVVRQAAGNTAIFGPLSPAGGVINPTIINNFMLVRFTQSSPSVQNSGWVDLDDLNQNDDECQRIRQCVDTNGPVYERAGGAIIPGADGVQWVEFTGHFAAQAITHAEIRLNNGTGQYGWVSEPGYVPLADQECEKPRMDCIEGDWAVYATSDSGDNTAIGYLDNAQVDVIGAPTDGRVQIRFAAGGPDGWVDEQAFYDGHNDCRPTLACYKTIGPAWTEYPTNGVSIPAINTPMVLEHRGKIVNGPPAYTRIGVGGIGYWVQSDQLIALHPARCEPPTIPDCPTGQTLPIDRYLDSPGYALAVDAATTEVPGAAGSIDDDVYPRPSECCVSALYITPDVANLAPDPVPASVLVVGTFEIAGVTWYSTTSGRFFRGVDVVASARCEMPECPAPTTYPTGTEVLRNEGQQLASIAGDLMMSDGANQLSYVPPTQGDCCVNALYTGPSFGSVQLSIPFPFLVQAVGGPIAPFPGWYLTDAGTWFPASAVVDAAACRPINCPTEGPPIPTVSSPEAMVYALALSIYVPGDSAECCIEGNLFDMPNGTIVNETVGATGVLVVGVSEDGLWHEVLFDGELLWVHQSSFRSNSDCLPPVGCPFAGSQTSATIEGQQVACCARFDPAGAQTFFEEVVVTGETRPAAEGGLEYNTFDHGWLHQSAFVGAGRCVETPATCPTLAVIDTSDLSTCCVSLGGAEFDQVELTGETRDIGGGVLEYLTTDGVWILESDFASAGRCAEPVDPCPNGVITGGICCQRGQVAVNGQCTAPCSNGQVRNPAGNCVTPAPATPQPTPTSSACLNSDNDGLCDVDDNCPFNTNPDQADRDNNGIGDECDTCVDSDGDTVCDFEDNCPEFPNPNQVDLNQNTVGDACERCFGADSDGDTICDDDDNCPNVWNQPQLNTYGDSRGDACEPLEPTCSSDIDGDGVCDGVDNCIETSNADQADTDRDGIGDKCDDCVGGDLDNDGICDDQDNCRGVSNQGQRDSDEDGVGNECDICPFEFNPGQGWTWDSNGDGINDTCTPLIS